MRHGDALRWSQLKVGILVFIGFLILVWVAFNSELPGVFKSEERLVARFASAGGLLAGTPVFFLGMEAGQVQAVEFDPTGGTEPIRVTFTVGQRIREELRADAAVGIGSFGILGDKFLELVRGDAAQPFPEGKVLHGRPETGFTDLIEPSRRTLTKVDGLLTELETISISLREGKGSVGKLLAEDEFHARLLGTLEEARATLTDFRSTQRELAVQLASAAGSIDSLAAGWRRADGTLNRLAEDPALYENLNAATVRLERVLAEMEQGQGLLARMLRDPELADQVNGLVVDLRALLQDMRENPGRYVQFSVF